MNWNTSRIAAAASHAWSSPLSRSAGKRPRRRSRYFLVLAGLAVSFIAPPSPASAAPSDDDIAGAVNISSLPFSHEVNTSEATVAADDPVTDCSGPLATVWYTFTPDQTRHVQIETIRSDYDTTLAVFSGRPGALAPEACNNDDADIGRTTSRVVFTATAGTQYFVMAGTCCGGDPGQVGPGGNLVLAATEVQLAPANDDVTGAVPNSGLPFSHQVNTSQATVGADDPVTDCSGPLATVWYTFTLDQTMHVQIDTVGSDYDTTLAVFSGSLGALELVTCNHEGVNVAPASRVVFTATAGTQYFVMAGTCCGGDPGQVGPGGNLVLNATEASQPPLDVTVAVNSGRVTSSGTAIVTGTVSCSHAATVNRMFVAVTQQFARFQARGQTPIFNRPCGPSPSEWSVEVISGTGIAFGPGPATTSVQALANDDLTFATDEVTKVIRLRRDRG